MSRDAPPTDAAIGNRGLKAVDVKSRDGRIGDKGRQPASDTMTRPAARRPQLPANAASFEPLRPVSIAEMDQYFREAGGEWHQ